MILGHVRVGGVITPDPLDGINGTTTVANHYAYGYNDPLNNTDPTGMRPSDRRFGVSGFLASDDLEVDALCETRLVLFETVVVFNRHDLATAGIDVVPTFRRPHVTLAHLELDELVSGLRACEHGQLENRYYEGTPP